MGCCCSIDDDSGPRPPSAQYGGGVPQQRQRKPKAFTGTGNVLGGGGVDSDSGINAGDAAAAAAMSRLNATSGTGATERDRKMHERRTKDDLIGKINAYYAQQGKDPPIGLGASTIDQLRKHLDYIKSETAKSAKTDAKISQIAGAMAI